MPTDIKLVKNNISKMIDQDAPEVDIRDYISSEGYNPDTFSQQSNSENKDKTLLHSLSDSSKNILPNIVNPIPPTVGLLDAVSKFITGKNQEQVEKPYPISMQGAKQAGSDALKAIPYGVMPEGSIPRQMAINGLANALSGAGSSLLDNGSIKESLKSGATQGAVASALSGALGLAGKGVENIFYKLKEPISDLMAFGGNIASSVPKNDYKRAALVALEGNSIFGKTKEEDKNILQDLYEKMRDSIKYVNNKSGESVFEQKKAIKNMSEIPKFDKKPVIDEINSMVKNLQTSHSVTSELTPQEENIIQNMKFLLSQKDLPIDAANAIKNNIQRGVYSNKGTTPIIDPSGPGEGILKRVASLINEQVKEKAPDLYKSNQGFSGIRDLSSKLNRKLSDFNSGPVSFKNNIRGNGDKIQIKELLNELDNSVPENLKFIDKTKDLLAREPFRNITSGQGGGSGSSEGLSNIIRGAGISGALYKGDPLLAGILGLSTSPVVHKGLLEAISKGVNISPKAGNLVKNIATPYGARTLDQIRKERGL